MPHYIPKGEFIIFECILGDEIIKEIELSNPTNSQISYWVNLEGSSDFTTKNCGNIENDTIKIEPKSKAAFKVNFNQKNLYFLDLNYFKKIIKFNFIIL